MKKSEGRVMTAAEIRKVADRFKDTEGKDCAVLRDPDIRGVNKAALTNQHKGRG